MKRLAVTNLKGGSCKTSVAVNLAAGLAELLHPTGRRVLMLDFDPQASASAWLGQPAAGSGLLEALAGHRSIRSLVVKTTTAGLELIAAAESLALAEMQLADDPVSQKVLRERLAKLPRRRWAAMVIDLPPALGWLGLSALTAASDVLVTVEGGMSITGLESMLATIGQVKRRLNPRLELLGVVQARVDQRTRIYRETRALLVEQFGELALQAAVRADVRMQEAPTHAATIYQHAPDCRAAEDCRQVTAEVAARLGLT